MLTEAVKAPAPAMERGPTNHVNCTSPEALFNIIIYHLPTLAVRYSDVSPVQPVLNLMIAAKECRWECSNALYEPWLHQILRATLPIRYYVLLRPW